MPRQRSRRPKTARLTRHSAALADGSPSCRPTSQKERPSRYRSRSACRCSSGRTSRIRSSTPRRSTSSASSKGDGSSAATSSALSSASTQWTDKRLSTRAPLARSASDARHVAMRWSQTTNLPPSSPRKPGRHRSTCNRTSWSTPSQSRSTALRPTRRRRASLRWAIGFASARSAPTAAPSPAFAASSSSLGILTSRPRSFVSPVRWAAPVRCHAIVAERAEFGGRGESTHAANEALRLPAIAATTTRQRCLPRRPRELPVSAKPRRSGGKGREGKGKASSTSRRLHARTTSTHRRSGQSDAHAGGMWAVRRLGSHAKGPSRHPTHRVVPSARPIAW